MNDDLLLKKRRPWNGLWVAGFGMALIIAAGFVLLLSP